MNKMTDKHQELFENESFEVLGAYLKGDGFIQIDRLQEFLSKAKNNGSTHIIINGSCLDETLSNIDIQAVSLTTE